MQRSHPQSRPHPGVAVYYVAALCSGAAALIYQIVWSKTLALTFGSTTQGAAAVIAGFMIGMGVGARFFGAWNPTRRRPGLYYAYLEVGIAGLGLALSPLLYRFAELAGAVQSAGVFGRFAGAMAILMAPAALMGATFPALCRAVIATNSELRDRLGPVYGFNTMGAAIGALAAGFLLIELLGGLGSAWVAAGLNLIAAGLVVVSDRGRDSAPAVSITPQKSASIESVVPDNALIVTAFLSGLGTLAYEIVWFRAAKYLIGNSTYAMSMVLAVFLLGLGLGGLLERRLARRAHLERDLVYAQLGIAVVALVSAGLLYAAINWIPLRAQFSVFAPAMAMRPWPLRLAWSLGATLVLLIPPTVLMGLTFPIVITLVTRSVERMGRGIGRVYLSANLGATIGAITGGLFMLPVLGTMGALKFTAALNLGIAGLLAMFLLKSRRLRIPIVAGVATVAAALIVLLPHRLDFQGELEGGTSRVLFAEEGDLATVKVTVASNNLWKGMTIDGYAIGIDRSLPRDITFKQLLLAHIPLVLHPEAKSVLNIGLGSATTQASLASYGVWERMDCVEISQSVVHGARFFDDGRVLDDPRVRLHVTDAVQFLRAGVDLYDVIVSDGKQNPQFPGNAALLSRELFESVEARLSPDGIMVQWIPLGFPPRAFDVMARTFASVFDEMSVYYYPPEALILVGGRGYIPVVIPPIRPSRFAQDLSPYLIITVEQLMAGWVTDGVGLRLELGSSPINTWDHPILEFWPYRDFDPRRAMADKGRNLELLERAAARSRAPRGVPEAVSAQMESAAYVRRGFTKFYQSGSPAEFELRLDSALSIHPADRLLLGLRERLNQGPGALLHSGPL